HDPLHRDAFTDERIANQAAGNKLDILQVADILRIHLLAVNLGVDVEAGAPLVERDVLLPLACEPNRLGEHSLSLLQIDVKSHSDSLLCRYPCGIGNAQVRDLSKPWSAEIRSCCQCASPCRQPRSHR